MKVLIQRVSQAKVEVDGEIVGQIAQGLLLLIGIEREDDSDKLERMAKKVLAYRIFSDDQGKMNLSLADINGGVLAISQFTLAAETKKGLRPGFSSAATPDEAERLYNEFVDLLKKAHSKVETGRFGANMQVSLTNNGPVTFLLEL